MSYVVIKNNKDRHMKRSKYNFRKTIFILMLLLVGINYAAMSQQANKYPYSTDTSNLTIWNGSKYVPFFIKGVNLGISIPGTFPGELAAERNHYSIWFAQIKEAGFNCIRLYTLHYPRFFEVLDSFNIANPKNPLLFLQGVWLEEEMTGYNNDLYFLSNAFRQEIEENIDCVHGNKYISPRVGKAHGSYTIDVSKWCLGYIMGREVHPPEVQTTNTANSGITSYYGNHFSIINASASEAWITSMIDHNVHYEETNYDTQRPVSFSSWPTLDPLIHPEEGGYEDSENIDLSNIQIIDAPASMFISYHAYPYYPDFISLQTSYQLYSDNYGPNSYLGYLTELKSHYSNFPLIIAEYGVPSSWVTAHYATSGMNHGGFDEYSQGLANIRILNTIRNTNCGGGIQFAWIDEWFKRTWITDPVDYIPEDRVLWHNVSSAEQNFGLISYEKTISKDTIIQFNTNTDISYAIAENNFSFFELEIGIKDPLNILDEMWITFDTYDENLGESILPSGETIPTRSEFALHLTNYSAELFVTQAYDIYGIWHNVSTINQLYHSVPTNGAPWKLVRIRNNYSNSDIQYIGNLQLNYDFQPGSSKDGVVIYEDRIKIKVPWSYLNVVAPNQMKVLHDYRSTPETEDTISDGFAISVNYKNQWYSSNNRFQWNDWNQITDTSVVEQLKTSYYVIKDNLQNFNTAAVAYRDSFYFSGPTFPVSVNAAEGLLNNDFDIDGNLMISLITMNPKNGQIYLNNDGSFIYIPAPGFIGNDSLMYCVYDGYTLSESNIVKIYVEQNETSIEKVFSSDIAKIEIFPNPCIDFINIKSQFVFDSFQIFDITGKLIHNAQVNKSSFLFDISSYNSGTYIIVARVNNSIISKKFVKR